MFTFVLFVAKLFQIRYGAYDFLRRLLEFFLSNLRGGKVEGYEQLTRLFDCLVPISELKVISIHPHTITHYHLLLSTQ